MEDAIKVVADMADKARVMYSFEFPDLMGEEDDDHTVVGLVPVYIHRKVMGITEIGAFCL